MKRLLLACVLSLFSVSSQANWAPTELITFGSSIVNVAPGNDPIPNPGNPTYPRALGEILGITGMNYGRGGIGTAPNQLVILRDDYLVNGPPIRPGTIHILGPWNDCSGGTCVGTERANSIAAIVEMVQLLTDNGAEHIYLSSSSLGGRIATAYAFAQTQPDPAVSFANIIATVDARQKLWADEVMVAALGINSQVRRLHLIEAMKDITTNPGNYGFSQTGDDVYLCFRSVGTGLQSCLEHPVFGENGSAPDQFRVIFDEGIHPAFSGHNSIAAFFADIIQRDAEPRAIPALSLPGLLVLITLLGGLAFRFRRRAAHIA